MSDLRVIPQPYGNLPAFVSVSPFLAGGWAAWTSNEATVLIEGNKVAYSIRLRGTPATSWNLTEQLPNELLPTGNPYLFAFIDGQPAGVKIQNRLITIPPEHRGSAFPEDIFISTSILPRRPQ